MACLKFFSLRRVRAGVLLLSMLLFSEAAAQVILTEIMFDPDTLEYHNEFVEIYNAGDSAVDLTEWSLGDSLELDALVATDGGMVLQPGQYAVILDQSYFGNSSTYDTLIPPEALILTIDDGSFGKYGWSNSHSEPVLLVNARGDTVQRYSYSVGNVPGYSDEKILLTPENDSSNWADSRRFRGTPGGPNSVAPGRFDLAVDSVRVEPLFPVEGLPVTLDIQLVNAGLEPLHRFVVRVFDDVNRDRVFQAEELLGEQAHETRLDFQEAVWVQFTLENLPAGSHLLGVEADLPGDENPANNRGFLELQVETIKSEVVINEILYAPRSGETEWVELFNAGTRAVDLSRWCFADARDTVRLTAESCWLAAGEFLVLSGDSAAAEQYHFLASQLLVVKPFPTLNNDWDDLKLLAPSGRLMERVTYSREWMGRETGPGTSLERIQPGVSSGIADNWTASVDPSGSTPGRQNSVFVESRPSVGEISIQPNPFSPDGDGFEDFVLIQYHFNLTTAYLSVDVFDILGRHVRRLASRLAVAAQGTLLWDGKDDGGRVVPMGVYILFLRLNDPQKDLYRELKATVVVAKR